MSLKKNLIFAYIVIIWATSFQYAHANSGESKKANSTKKRIHTLWSDKSECTEKDALYIAIETYEGTFKVAACAKHGCKIAVREFGKRAHPGDIKQNPKFNWISETELETKINGKLKRLYLCPS